MRAFLKHLPIILLAIFEMVVGIMLFIDPESLTKVIIAIFGVRKIYRNENSYVKVI